ncbi:hypothetical protein HID58_014145 [Brassica napus]|uniref:DUF4283 domain-containing protein n=1 Tax=Brassica napus TaxID=3708 RepID=A0ABQ8DI59_BRANA|nr:hypothetical protein HID58_014145 [Brassica napus]
MLLGRTCWKVAGFPMFVAPWSPEFNPEEAPLTSAVIPVELREVPYLLFNKESLGRLATAVGKPVSLAPETERKLNFKVAKLYVKVDLTKPLPHKIISGYSNGKETEISVTYPWLPMKCELCKKFGHLQNKCRTVSPGSASARKRSSSPVGTETKARNRSRPSRARTSNKGTPPQTAYVVTEVEEGEISVVAQETLIPTASDSKQLSEAGHPKSVIVGNSEDPQDLAPDRRELHSDSEGAIGAAGGSDAVVRDNPSSDEQTSLPAEAGGAWYDNYGRDTDDPFYLVNRRQSGRRAKSSQ